MRVSSALLCRPVTLPSVRIFRRPAAAPEDCTAGQLADHRLDGAQRAEKFCAARATVEQHFVEH